MTTHTFITREFKIAQSFGIVFENITYSMSGTYTFAQ